VSEHNLLGFGNEPPGGFVLPARRRELDYQFMVLGGSFDACEA